MNRFGRVQHPISLDDEGGDQDPGSAQSWWERTFTLAGERRERYRIFEEMDTFGLISAILDVYSEETTQPDYDKGQSIWIESKSSNILTAGAECLRNIQAEDRAAPIARRIIKYGDGFQRLIYQTGKGVLGWKYAHASKCFRLEDKYGRLIGFREDGKTFRQKKRPVSWPWDYVHFRLLGRDEESGYGSALLENLFRPWRQLTLAEDAVLTYRLRRAPERNLIMIDVGSMEEHEALEYVNGWRKRFRKRELVDPASPDYKKQYNPLSPTEDIFIPVRGQDQSTRIESLTAAAGASEVYDLDYFRDKFFGSAKVPKAYFGFEGEINAKATLMQQDVRFARTAKRLRKALVYGFRTVLDIHYTLLPTDPENTDFDLDEARNQYIVQMSPIAYLDEFERLELIQLRYQVVDSMANLAQTMQIDPKVWAMYILLNYAKIPEELVQKLIVHKPAEEPGTPGGLESDGLSQRERKKLLEDYGPEMLNQVVGPIGTQGYYADLSNDEVKALNEAIHRSPKLRKVLGDITEYALEEDIIQDRSIRQTDPSLLPPTTEGTVVILGSDYDDDPEAKVLKEDMDALQMKAVEEAEKEKERKAISESSEDDALIPAPREDPKKKGGKGDGTESSVSDKK